MTTTPTATPLHSRTICRKHEDHNRRCLDCLVVDELAHSLERLPDGDVRLIFWDGSSSIFYQHPFAATWEVRETFSRSLAE